MTFTCNRVFPPWGITVVNEYFIHHSSELYHGCVIWVSCFLSGPTTVWLQGNTIRVLAPVRTSRCWSLPRWETSISQSAFREHPSPPLTTILLHPQVFTHPGWNPSTINNDITLIKLATPATLGTNVSPVCLAGSSDNYPAGMTCVTSGWGLLRYNGETSQLQISVFFSVSSEPVNLNWG